MTIILSGPMAEPPSHDGHHKIFPSEGRGGAHYSVWHLDAGDMGKGDPEVGMRSLRQLFPDGKATENNFVLFSTSGVHGSYTTLEEIESGLAIYGDDFDPGDYEPDDWHGNTLTVLVVQPRIVCLRCGNIRVREADIPYLKALRASSLAAISDGYSA